jgi:hypothetical protein
MMRIELTNKCSREMWYFDRELNSIWPVFVVAESKSGDTVDTNNGQRLRTSTKTHAIFYTWDYARIAQKLNGNELDSEYDELLRRNKLRRRD